MRTGRAIGHSPLTPERPAPVDLPATILAAAARTAATAERGIVLERQDLRVTDRAIPRHRLIVFIVDASDSMGEGTTTTRMAAAKGAILTLLKTAYLSRDKVCMITFQDDRAVTFLAPTGSVDTARERLRRLPVGGSSPLSRGLMEGWRVIRRERHKDPAGRPVLVLLSDGAANTPVDRSLDAATEARGLARRIAEDDIPAIIIETGAGRTGGLMQDLAAIFKTTCHRTGRLDSGRVLRMVEAAGQGP